MANFLLNTVKNKYLVGCFMFVGLLLNNVLHLYRFNKVGWTQVTGLWGNHRSIRGSFFLCLRVVPPILLAKYIIMAMRRRPFTIIVFSIIFSVASQATGRSVLKLTFDILTIGTFLGWFFIDATYGAFLSTPPLEKAFSYVISELTIIFQTSLAMLTFVIATFGFSFAPSYIEKYYQESIGQPTVWWFAASTIYLTIGILAFICVYPWLIAIYLRSKL